jgi:hypothetical protein
MRESCHFSCQFVDVNIIKTVIKMNNSAAPSFLRDFAKLLLLTTPIAPIAALSTNEAKQARKDQSGFFPESGLTEGYRALMPSKHFVPAVTKTALDPLGIPLFAGLFSKAAQEARKDQSGYLPEIGLSEAFQVSNPLYDYNNAPKNTSYASEAGEIEREKYEWGPDGQPSVVDPYLGMSTKISDKPIDTYEQFVERTRNSPAMRAGVFDPKDLYQTYISDQDFQVARDTGNLEDFARAYPLSQTAKKMRSKVPYGRPVDF